jgi:hypothetical protein
MKILTARPISIPSVANQVPGTAMDITRILPGFPFHEAAEFSEDVFIAPQRFPLGPTRRLVVLIPESDLDENALAHRIWNLASLTGLQVLFLGLSPDEESAPFIRRRLALLASAIHQGEVRARSSVVVGVNWSRAVKKVLHLGDLVVCIEGHKVPRRGFGRWRLGEALSADFDVPVYLLAGLQIGRSPVQLQSVRSLIAWSLSIIVLLTFGGFQVWISQNDNSTLSVWLICLTIVAEGIALFKLIEWIG